jgi:hypothetical protein
MSTNDERAKDAEALAVFALIERGTEPVESADVTAAYLHLAARLDSLAGERDALAAELARVREALGEMTGLVRSLSSGAYGTPLDDDEDASLVRAEALAAKPKGEL